MSGLHEVDCGGCGRRYEMSVEQALAQRVLRCACGEFVRLDQGSLEPGPTFGSPPAAELADADDNEQNEPTHLLGSLEAIAALGGPTRRLAREPSPSDHEPAAGLPRRTSHSLAPEPLRPPSTPPVDKPLWYVDLGGSETVQMTIEQVIVARRSGKLGEGALVWRQGMADWRPVGSLIPAVSRPTPTPPAPSRPPPPRAPSRPAPAPAVSRGTTPSPPPEALAPSLASYERPVATLEFALEQPAQPTRSPLPVQGHSPSRPARAPTPLPRAAPEGNAIRAAAAARVTTATPVPVLPPLSSPPAARTSPVPAARPSASPSRPLHSPSESATLDWLGDRPRWLSACIALLVCFTASGSGAFLVRSLKQRKQPLALTSTALTQAKASAPAASSVPAQGAARAAGRPQVVELESLSIEHSPARPVVRPVVTPLAKVPATPLAASPSSESLDTVSDDSPVALPSATQRPKTSDLPAAARANPYTTGSVDDALTRKKSAPDNDEPGL